MLPIPPAMQRPPLAPAPQGQGAVAEAPPFWLPGWHFGAALLLWLAGSAGLTVIAEELAQGLYPLPVVVSVTHLFTLGWLTLSIQGALYQFLPVAVGIPIRSQWLAVTGLVAYVPGLLLFLAGLLWNLSWARGTGAALFGSALLGFVVNLGLTLKRAAGRDLTWWCLASAALFLAATVVLGAALAVNLGNGMLRAHRAAALGVHLHVALFGWVVLVMIGVARHLLPMFLLSHGVDVRLFGWAAWGVGGGTAVLLSLHHAPPVLSRVIPAVLIAGGGAAFLVQAGLLYKHRRRPRLDPGMRLAAMGLVLFGAGLVQGPRALAGGAGATHAWTGYLVTLVLGISLFIAGHYYKIVPFLVWFHRYGPLAGTRPLPTVADLYSARVANAAAALLASGAVLASAGAAVAGSAVTRAGAVLYGAGAVLVNWQMLRLSRRRP